MGIIYIATSPSGKSYVGQTVNTIFERWREHIYDAYDVKKDHCKLLNRAIRKYNQNNFELQCVCECSNDELDKREQYYIQLYNTMKPNGYNLTSGGRTHRHLQETKDRVSQKLKGIPKSVDSLLKRSQTKKGGNGLPMYVIESRRNGIVNGYRVTHPKFPEKRFIDKKLTMPEKLQLALQHLDSLTSHD